LIAALPAGLYRIESTVAGGFYASPTTAVTLAVVDPAPSVTGTGSIPTAALPPYDKATFGFKVKYANGGTSPGGHLRFTRKVPADDTQVGADNAQVGDAGALVGPDDPPVAAADAQAAAGNPCQGSRVDPNGGIVFRSTSFDWLVITGSIAQVQGVGTLNGCSGFHFRVIATQGSLTGDTFEIHLWDATHSFDAPLLLASGTLNSGKISIVRPSP
jgi:hypothetical protein